MESIIKQKIKWEKTKIIGTIGPASASKDALRNMIIAGLDVCRLNFSHGSHEDHQKVINNIRELNKELNTHIPLLADLQGPKIRIGLIQNDGIDLKNNDELIITSNECIGTKEKIYIKYPEFPKDVKKGERILIDDGKIMMEIISSNNIDEVKAKVIYGGILSSKKGVNLPNTAISQPCLTEKDLIDLSFALKNKVEWVALSFVRKASDIQELKDIIASNKDHNSSLIIAKIEKPEALIEIDSIINLTDAVMVARGDLGVEIPLEEVPLVQKDLVRKCLKASVPIIIATQMMETMISNHRPTRAEVNDVANSVTDGADAVMLSGETSVGKFPVKVIETMQKIILDVETIDEIYHKNNHPVNPNCKRFITDSICVNACEISNNVKAKAIIGMTYSGYSAFKIASQRPKAGIFIFTNNRKLLCTLNLVWGVRGFYYNNFESTDNTVEEIKIILLKEKFITKGDLIINIASTPIEEKGKTNMLKLSLA